MNNDFLNKFLILLGIFIIFSASINFFVKYNKEKFDQHSFDKIISYLHEYYSIHGKYPNSSESFPKTKSNNYNYFYYAENENKDFKLKVQSIKNTSKTYFYCSSNFNSYCDEHEDNIVNYTKTGKWILRHEND